MNIYGNVYTHPGTTVECYIKMTDEEMTLAKEYADTYNVTLAEAFKQALFERIECELDTKIGEEAYERYLANPKTRTLKELIDEE